MFEQTNFETFHSLRCVSHLQNLTNLRNQQHRSIIKHLLSNQHQILPDLLVQPSNSFLVLSFLSNFSFFLHRNGKPMCQCRWTTIAFGAFILTLCAIAILVPVGFNLKGPDTTSTTTSNEIYFLYICEQLFSMVSNNNHQYHIDNINKQIVFFFVKTCSRLDLCVASTTTTPPATAWIPSNYFTSCLYTCTSVSTVTPSTLIASWTFEQNVNDVSGNGR